MYIDMSSRCVSRKMSRNFLFPSNIVVTICRFHRASVNVRTYLSRGEILLAVAPVAVRVSRYFAAIYCRLADVPLAFSSAFSSSLFSRSSLVRFFWEENAEERDVLREAASFSRSPS